MSGFFTYGLYIGEVLAPMMLVADYRSRVASLLIIGTMITAILMLHMSDVFALNAHGNWAIELQMFYILSSVVIIFLGSEKYTLFQNFK